ncbi:MAG: UDP-glucose/GDP-mannose dehydrogenase family protein [Rhodothermales bacterium]|nr:UDP-glucose/GDP-mannose dehydrogenase family protein [Rhodothermales bacterium]MBO6780956.1 UDP-glucose/GDP-mannose dehydrogenase family protein [Rhodothermales bacterium]
MHIAVVGTGYVGLVTGTCFADTGFRVTCVDIDEAKVRQLRQGKPTIYEAGLEGLLQRSVREHRLTFTTSLPDAADSADVLFLALPTPPGADGSADLSYVLKVADDLGEYWAAQPTKRYRVVVNKSTVPVGTADLVREALEKHGLTAGDDFDVVSNPEFLREGVAVTDFMKPERVVVGTSSERAAEIMRSIYEPFVRQGNPILIMDERSSEMTKYAANSFLAMKVSFINEVANLCEYLGANVDEVRVGIGLDSRVGNKFLYPGLGFGGSCFPKDVQALKLTSEQNGYFFETLNAVLNVNARQHDKLPNWITERFGDDLTGKRLAVWGLAFKAKTDDIRESPALAVVRKLLAKGATIRAFDPEAIANTKRELGDQIEYATNMYDALEGADALVICTEWHEFRRPDWDRISAGLKNKVIFDGRNLYKPHRVAELGFDYLSVGRPHMIAESA